MKRKENIVRYSSRTGNNAEEKGHDGKIPWNNIRSPGFAVIFGADFSHADTTFIRVNKLILSEGFLAVVNLQLVDTVPLASWNKQGCGQSCAIIGTLLG